MKRPRHVAQDDHAATTERDPAGSSGVGQEVLDVAAQPLLLEIEPLGRGLVAPAVAARPSVAITRVVTP